jgi:hypothetical protein
MKLRTETDSEGVAIGAYHHSCFYNWKATNEILATKKGIVNIEYHLPQNFVYSGKMQEMWGREKIGNQVTQLSGYQWQATISFRVLTCDNLDRNGRDNLLSMTGALQDLFMKHKEIPVYNFSTGEVLTDQTIRWNVTGKQGMHCAILSMPPHEHQQAVIDLKVYANVIIPETHTIAGTATINTEKEI